MLISDDELGAKSDPKIIVKLEITTLLFICLDVEWLGKLPVSVTSKIPAKFFWDTLTGSDESIATKLKDLGNKAFVSKRFNDANRWYNLAEIARVEYTYNASTCCI